MKKVYWDEAANPIGTHLSNIIYELRSEDDGEDLILDAVCLEDFEETADSVAYDALVTEYRLLERKMNIMRRVMNRVSADLKVREDNGPDDMGVIISKPFKRNGTSNVAALFQLTDGQTISIVFHNPDTTPNRIMPTDELISWKWMINKKDVTIVVAPEKGQDLNVNEVARRIMRLAEKNSAAFKRANERRAERIANIEKQKVEIEDLEAELSRIKSECEASEVEYQDALEKLDSKKKERTVAIEKAEERKREQEKREAEELAKKEAEDSKRQDDLRKAMESLGLRTPYVKAIEQNIKPGKYHGHFVWDADGLGFLEEIGLADYSQNAKTGIYYAQNGERLNDAESQAVFEKFVSGLQIDLTPGKPPVYMFNDGTRMTDSEMVSLVTGDGIENVTNQNSEKDEEDNPTLENPVQEVDAETVETSGEPAVVLPNYPVRQVKLSDLLKGGKLWDKGNDVSRTYLSRANLMKLAGFKLGLSASRKNLRFIKGPDGNDLPDSIAENIWSRLQRPYWDNVKKEVSDKQLMDLLRFELIDDVTGTDKDVTPGAVGLYADLWFPDVHVPIPEGFVPVLDPLFASKERKKAKAKRKKPSWSHILVEGETEKAYKVRYGDPEGYFDGNEQEFDIRVHIPKSQCVVDGNHLVATSKWIAEQYRFPYSIEPVMVVPREPEENKQPLDVKEGLHDLTTDQENQLFDLLYDNEILGDPGKEAVKRYGGKPRIVKSELLDLTEGRKQLELLGVIDGGQFRDVLIRSIIKWRPEAGMALNVESDVWGVSLTRAVVDYALKAKILSYMGVDFKVSDDDANADPKHIKVSQIVKFGKLWEKAGKVRTYFNGEIDDVLELIGFKVERSTNGKVMSVTDPDGEIMSNNKYWNLRASLFKSYYDHVSHEFRNRDGAIDMDDKFSKWDITFEDDLIPRSEASSEEPTVESKETVTVEPQADPIAESKEDAITEEQDDSQKGAIDVQWEADNAYLQTLIDGTADMGDRKTHSSKLREIYGRVKDDAEKMGVLQQAMNAWEADALGRASVFKS